MQFYPLGRHNRNRNFGERYGRIKKTVKQTFESVWGPLWPKPGSPKTNTNFKNKACFVRHALDSRARGRPSGGIEAYVTESLKPRLIFDSDKILALNIKGISGAGCSFKPSLDLDDIINDLTILLEKVPDPNKILILGDFNLKPNSHEMDELITFLEHFNIYLGSDPECHTLIHSAGSSCLDQIFISNLLVTEQTLVHEMSVSDHKPISAIIRVPCRTSSNSSPIPPFKGVDLEQVSIRLRMLSECNPNS